MGDDFRHLLRERWQINWQTLAAIAKILGVLVAIIVASYPFWPRMKVQAVVDDVGNYPLRANFHFQYTGGFDIDGAVISCTVKFGSRTIKTTGVLFGEQTGKKGQVLGRLGAGAPPIVRTCGPPYLTDVLHPATISIDVTWHSFKIGHQYFISQQTADGRCCLMVPESDPLAR
ncbi:hypothetical protein IVB30_19720 [Bradyrhizobium sp. 200]|uniref:hypothetical protein n=1 Tax=Bradyrhizobium sp. 200 TaxID=2782665 RepID=UPI001FFE9711|nr:hypothetical protein [Bradyrhizobium sp. 200]UPJ53342.1 hypothetical protein IVB30_19720 [Bradyrhizobium sp. 200]